MLIKESRLTNTQLKAIIETFKACFLESDQLWLFGSRVDLSKKGGDIDLYIETHATDLGWVAKTQITFLTQLKRKIGEQKIDVVIHRLSEPHVSPICQEAKKTGILLV